MKNSELKEIILNLSNQLMIIKNQPNYLLPPLKVDDGGLQNTLYHLRETLRAMIDSLRALDITEALNEIKQISKKMSELETSLSDIKEEFICKLSDDPSNNLKSTHEQDLEKIKDASYLTVKQLILLYPAFSIGSLRWLIFNAQHNGFHECIKKLGKKILIDVKKFDFYIQNQTFPDYR